MSRFFIAFCRLIIVAICRVMPPRHRRTSAVPMFADAVANVYAAPCLWLDIRDHARYDAMQRRLPVRAFCLTAAYAMPDARHVDEGTILDFFRDHLCFSV